MCASGRRLILSFLRTLLCALYSVACRLSRYLSGSGPIIPVYDLVLAGPNNRFTTPNLTAHNCTLGLGYQTAAPKFQAFAKTYGVDLTLGEAEDAVADWRRKNWRIVRLWKEHHDALAFSARRKDDTHQIEFRSGRILTYWQPRLAGREITVYQVRGAPRSYIYGGKICENETQGSCRDILCDAWLAMDRAGLPPVTLTVHDEIVMEARADEAPQIAKEVERLMTTSSPWAEGLPLGAKVTISDRYTK